jgi:adenosylcobinamide kinase/adenosylcobinamide-phosphate guanylyltransferase
MTLKIFYIGGVKSGKSRLAEQQALTLAAQRDPWQKPFYVATADPQDPSMHRRIDRHRQDRGEQFITLEEPFDLLRAIHAGLHHHQVLPQQGVILIDCLTLWLSNLLLQAWQQSPAAVDTLEHSLGERIQALLDLPHTLIFVLNDVGSGIHADTALGRRFADLSGLTAQHIAPGCNEVPLHRGDSSPYFLTNFLYIEKVRLIPLSLPYCTIVSDLSQYAPTE